jgi:hypothetical protein
MPHSIHSVPTILTLIKDIKIFHSKAFQNVTKVGIWFENEPSGNPAERKPILTLPNLQLQRQHCSRLEVFSKQKKIFVLKTH